MRARARLGSHKAGIVHSSLDSFGMGCKPCGNKPHIHWKANLERLAKAAPIIFGLFADGLLPSHASIAELRAATEAKAQPAQAVAEGAG